MTGKLKTKGNMMLATKLDGLLQVRSLLHCGEQSSANNKPCTHWQSTKTSAKL